MDTIEGVWFPEGGMHAVPTAMAAAAEKAGASSATASGGGVAAPARQRRVSPACGWRSGEQLHGRRGGLHPRPADRVRAAAARLNPPRPLAAATYSPSAVVWHVGVRGLPGPDGRAPQHPLRRASGTTAFDALLKRGELMPDPSRLVTVPSLDDPTPGPAGCSTLYVLETGAQSRGRIDWRPRRGRCGSGCTPSLRGEGYPSRRGHRRLVTPLDWQAQGMAAGTPFALAHTFAQTGPFRPPNVERRVPGLVFAGSGTVPGVGVPMVLISGKLAAERVAHTCPDGRDERLDLAGDLADRGLPTLRPADLEYGTTYFWGAALLPKPQRRHVYAVYALCRLADDIVDSY